MAKVQDIDIREWYEEAQEAWGVAALPPLAEIRVTLQPNMTRAGGRAFPKSFKRRNGQRVNRDWYGITLSKPWFQAILLLAPESFDAEFRDTVLHELAHLACYYVYPAGACIGHGWQWQEFCRQVGCKPTPYMDDGSEYLHDSEVTWEQVSAQKDFMNRR